MHASTHKYAHMHACVRVYKPITLKKDKTLVKYIIFIYDMKMFHCAYCDYASKRRYDVNRHEKSIA